MKTINTHNVIILDKSGSMNSIRQQALDSANEVIQAIRCQAEKDPDNHQFLTFVVFCDCQISRIYNDTPIAEVRNLSLEDYRPCCMTPLYDAIGQTIVPIHDKTKEEKGCVVSVNIITDGYENASKEFDGKTIANLIASYKEEGWLFSYMGADHDVEKVAAQMHIDNHLHFAKTPEGMKNFSSRWSKMHSLWLDKSAFIERDENIDEDERIRRRRDNNKDYFG